MQSLSTAISSLSQQLTQHRRKVREEAAKKHGSGSPVNVEFLGGGGSPGGGGAGGGGAGGDGTGSSGAAGREGTYGEARNLPEEQPRVSTSPPHPQESTRETTGEPGAPHGDAAGEETGSNNEPRTTSERESDREADDGANPAGYNARGERITGVTVSPDGLIDFGFEELAEDPSVSWVSLLPVKSHSRLFLSPEQSLFASQV